METDHTVVIQVEESAVENVVDSGFSSSFDFINNSAANSGHKHGTDGGDDDAEDVAEEMKSGGIGGGDGAWSLFANMEVKVNLSDEDRMNETRDIMGMAGMVWRNHLNNEASTEATEDDNENAEYIAAQETSSSQFSFIDQTTSSATVSSMASSHEGNPRSSRPERSTRRRQRKTPVVGYARNTPPSVTDSDLPVPSSENQSTLLINRTESSVSMDRTSLYTSAAYTSHDTREAVDVDNDDRESSELNDSEGSAPDSEIDENDVDERDSVVEEHNSISEHTDVDHGVHDSALYETMESDKSDGEGQEEDALIVEWWKLQSEMREAFDLITSQSHSISMEKGELFSKKRRNEEKLQRLALDIEYNERQLATVMEREDFDRADQLQTKIEEADAKRAKTKKKQENLGKQLMELEKREMELPRSMQSSYELFKERMELFHSKYSDDFNDFLRDSQLKINFSAEKIKLEEDRLEREQKNMKHDMEVIERRRQSLQSKIDEQTVDIRAERDELAEKLSVLELEMQELRRQLALKEQECSKIRKGMLDADKLIAKQRGKFDRELRELTIEEDKYEKKQVAFKEEQERFHIEREQMEHERIDLQQRQNVKSQHLNMLRAGIRSARQSVNIIERFALVDGPRKEKIREDKTEDGSEDALASLQRDHQKALLDIQACEKRLSDLKVSNTILAQQLQDATERMFPQLEKEKQLAAQSRNFKEAARVKNQLQQLTEKHQQWQQQFGSQQSEIEKLQDDFDSKQFAEKNLHEKIKEIRIQKHMDELRELLREQYRLERMLQTIEFLRTKEEMDTSTSKDMVESLSVMQNSLLQMLETQKETKQLELDEISKKVDMKEEGIGKLREEVESQLHDHFDNIQLILQKNVMEDDVEESPDDRRTANENEDENVSDGLRQDEDVDKNVEEQPLLQEPGNATSVESDAATHDCVVEEDVEVDTFDLEEVQRDLVLLHDELSQFEADLDQAIADEEYELCDELDTKIQDIRQRIAVLEQKKTVNEQRVHEDEHEEEKEEDGELGEEQGCYTEEPKERLEEEEEYSSLPDDNVSSSPEEEEESVIHDLKNDSTEAEETEEDQERLQSPEQESFSAFSFINDESTQHE